MTRKNILFLLNDHQAYYRHGWDGGPKVQRPSFAKLAQKGVSFENAYCAAPLCGPARRSMLTGLYPHSHRELDNDVNHPFDKQTYLQVLRENGYDNYYFGKWHTGPGDALEHHCQGFSQSGYGNPYRSPEYHDYLQRTGLPKPQFKVDFNLCEGRDADYAHKLSAAAETGSDFTTDFDDFWFPAAGRLLTPKETHSSFFLADLACRQLKQLAESDSDRPFHLRVDFWAPHQPYFATSEFTDLYPPEQIPEYKSFRDNLATKPDIYWREENEKLSHNNRLNPNAMSWQQWQQLLSLCYGQITLADQAAGLILDCLEELGLSENTIVLWTTDHGDTVASHGGHFDKDQAMPEELLRIPMAMSYPGKIEQGVTNSALVSNLDIGPTILDAAGCRYDQPVHGKSLLSSVTQDESQRRNNLVIETHGRKGSRYFGRAIIQENFKYVYNHKDRDELYHLISDPYELDNLIHSPEHAERVETLRRELRQWQLDTGDDKQLDFELPSKVMEPETAQN